MRPHIEPLLNKKSAIYMLNLLSIGNHSIFTQLFSTFYFFLTMRRK
nr:MAG TPA: hypothetical protein [Caudoviricetes sp.]